MEQKDLFLKELDQFGRALANAIARFANADYSASAAKKTEDVNQLLETHLNISLNELINLDSGDFINHLITELKIDPLNFDKLAVIIEECAMNYSDAKGLYQKVLIIQEYLLQHSINYSLERQEKINWLKNCISS